MPTELLVTGASGFIGRHLAPALEACGYTVRRFSGEDGDIASTELPFDNIGHVFHLAAKVFVPESWSDPRPFYKVNVLGTANVLEFCRRQKASVTLISSYVYGKPETLPISEDHPLDPFNPYCQTKILSEEIGRFYEKSFALPVTIVRPFNLYGAGQDARFLIPSLVRQALDPAQDEIRIADPRPKRDYLYIGDLVELLIGAFRAGAHGTYNAGSGVSLSVEEVVRRVVAAAKTGKRVVASGEERPQEVMDVVADVSKARREIGWEPRTGFDEGIAQLVKAAAAAVAT